MRSSLTFTFMGALELAWLRVDTSLELGISPD